MKIEDFWFLATRQLENDFHEKILPRIMRKPAFHDNQTGSYGNNERNSLFPSPSGTIRLESAIPL